MMGERDVGHSARHDARFRPERRCPSICPSFAARSKRFWMDRAVSGGLGWTQRRRQQWGDQAERVHSAPPGDIRNRTSEPFLNRVSQVRILQRRTDKNMSELRSLKRLSYDVSC